MKWKVDNAHTLVQFSAKHMMVSKVRGTFDRMKVEVEYDDQHPEDTRVQVEIEAASVNTRFEMRDKHLRSADFFDVANHPIIRYISKRVELIDEKHARLYGDLTVRGVTQEIILKVESPGITRTPWGTVYAGFKARTKVNRKKWNLNWNQVVEAGAVMVGDEVTIDVELGLTAEQEPA